MPDTRLILSCEHGGNRVPARYRQLFAGHSELLASHRGWDPGVLAFARRLAARLEAPLHGATVTRLLVDLNRSPASPSLFSEITRALSREEKERIHQRYYRPYREAVRAAVAAAAEAGPVLHLSLHSFTPQLNGTLRRAEIGLLYDPSRRAEAHFCATLRHRLRLLDPSLRVMRNAPYRGVSDALVTTLRQGWPEERYLGIELEINQKFPAGDPRRWKEVQETLSLALEGTSQGGGVLLSPDSMRP